MLNRTAVVSLLALLLLVAPRRAAGDPVAAPTTAATQAQTQAAIEQVLVAMEKAVLAGDADAYTAHIATRDAVFLQEQRMWAADLKRHVPSAFDLRIIDPAERQANEEASKAAASSAETTADNNMPGTPADPTEPSNPSQTDYPHEFGADRAMFELEMAWKITVPLAAGEKGKPDEIDRSVSYPVIFERSANRWLFAGERWVEVRASASSPAPTDADDADDTHPPAPKSSAASTRDNLVLCFPGYEEVAQRIAEVLPEVRAHVDEGFEQDVPHTQVVKIYPTMRHLQSSIYLSYADGLSGWNEPLESIKVLVRPKTSRASLRPLLAHEYGHVATFELGPKATDIPWWALEGVAELASEGFRKRSGRADEQVRKWAAAGELAEFSKITDFRNTPRQFMGHVYTQGHHMVAYISERFGRANRNAWFRAMANGASINEATRKELGVEGGFEQLDVDWRAEVSKPAGENAP